MFGRQVDRRKNVNYAQEWAELEAWWKSHSDALDLSPLQKLARNEGTVRLGAEMLGADASRRMRLVDEARGLQFQSNGTRGRNGPRAWTLKLENTDISVSSQGPLDLSSAGQAFGLSLDVKLGTLPVGPLWSAEKARPADTAHRLQLIAIECLIEWGILGDGVSAPDGRWRVFHEGRLFWRAHGMLWSAPPPHRAARGIALADEWLHLDWS